MSSCTASDANKASMRAKTKPIWRSRGRRRKSQMGGEKECSEFALGFRRCCFHAAAETSRRRAWTDTGGTPQRRASTSNELYRAHDPPARIPRCNSGAGLSAARKFSQAFFLLEKGATAQRYRFPAARDLCRRPSRMATANHTAVRGTTAKAIAAAPRKIESPAWAHTPTWSPAR